MICSSPSWQGARLVLCALLWMALGSCAAEPSAPLAGVPVAQPQAGRAAQGRLNAALTQSPLSFIPNRGQLDRRVAYYAPGQAATVYFTSEGITFALDRPGAERVAGEGQDWRRWVFSQQFLGARADVAPLGQQPAATVVSYFKGPRSAWQANLPTYQSLIYGDLWPGIDLVYAGASDQLKYTFVVKPGADPHQIAWAYQGLASARLAEDGRLELATPAGNLADERPLAFQELNGKQVAVAASYSQAAGAPGGDRFGFQVGTYDASKPLLIDPAVLVYGGFFGGAGYDAGSAIALDSAGNAYITGATFSADLIFPAAPGPDTSFNGSVDAFVAKISADGTRLLYAGYLGGTGFDQGSGIGVDSAGNAYVVGQTQSSEASFPATLGPDLTYNGGTDAFAAKISADGARLLYAGYLGGLGFDQGSAVAVDAAGNAYVSGQTQSSEASFPATLGPDLTYNGGTDAFVAKIAPDGARLLYAGYLGGTGSDTGAGMALGADGSAYLTGSTSSSAASFPATFGPDLTYNGGTDAFVAKVAPDGVRLLYAGYLGGSNYDAGASIAVDAAGNAFVGGETQSSASSFPVKAGPDLTFNGGIDAFVAKVAADGTNLLYAGYLGGAGNDGAAGIALGSTGVAYLAGTTASSDQTFPLVGGPDLSYNGASDGYLAKVSADGKQLLYAGYLGGAGDDEAAGLAATTAGDAYVTGFTSSTEASFPIGAGPDATFNGDHDAFALRLATAPDLQLLASTQPSLVFPSVPLTYTLSISSIDALKSIATDVVLTDTLPANVVLVSAKASQGNCSGTSTIVCALGQLGSGATAVVSIVVIPQQLGTIRNTASVTSGEPEPNAANNTVIQDTPVVVLSYLPLVGK